MVLWAAVSLPLAPKCNPLPDRPFINMRTPQGCCLLCSDFSVCEWRSSSAEFTRHLLGVEDETTGGKKGENVWWERRTWSRGRSFPTSVLWRGVLRGNSQRLTPPRNDRFLVQATQTVWSANFLNDKADWCHVFKDPQMFERHDKKTFARRENVFLTLNSLRHSKRSWELRSQLSWILFYGIQFENYIDAIMAFITLESFTAINMTTQVLDLKMKTIFWLLKTNKKWSGDKQMQGDISVFVFYFFSFFFHEQEPNVKLKK